jgi:polyisoprenoid-binding protein YceI
VRRRLLILGVAVALLAAVGFWWFVYRDDAPPPAALQSCADEPGEEVTTDGRWEVVRGDEVFVGYRIDEQFGGDTLSRTVAGRTTDVTGALVLEDGELSEASVEADLTALESDEPRRDAFLGGRALETDDIPTATFTLTEPVRLPDPVRVGEGVVLDAVGTLDLHGVRRAVTIELDSCVLASGEIEVAGSLPIRLADHEIETPVVPGLVTVEDHGAMELQLRFARR